jgi:hypothetical protein
MEDTPDDQRSGFFSITHAIVSDAQAEVARTALKGFRIAYARLGKSSQTFEDPHRGRLIEAAHIGPRLTRERDLHPWTFG